MAECRFLMCSHCEFSVEAWSDGNPYYRDEQGRKRYAYHPDHENVARCIGNDEPHLCMACGSMLKVDSQKRMTACRKCKAGSLVDVRNLEGEECPKCSIGKFVIDRERFSIS